MPVMVRIPTPLRSATKGNAQVEAKGDSVDQVLADLERQFPGLKERLESLYLDQRIDWSPGNIPTASPGAPMTIGNVPEEERAEVEDFLRRHCA